MLHFFHTLLKLAQAVFFLAFGAIAALIPWSTRLQELVVQFVRDHYVAVSLAGLGFLALGVVLSMHWRRGTKRHYHYIRSGARSVAIDEQLVDSYLKSYWQDCFPELDIESQASLLNHQLQILVHFPPVSKAEQKQILTRVQNELEELLTQSIGYHEPFRLRATFGEA